MNITNPDPNKKFPDLKFVIVENKQDNPVKLNMVYTSSPPRLRSVGRINTLYDMHDLMSKSFEIIAPLKDDAQPYIENLYTTSGFNIDRNIQEYGIYLAPDFPEFLIPKATPSEYKTSPQVVRNAITWGVVRQEPGTVSQDEPFRGTRELKPRVREFIVCYNDISNSKIINPGSTLIRPITDKYAFMKTKGQYFDNYVQYNIWAKTNYEAERITEWFLDEYMDNYIGMFREAGIVNMWFDRRVRDDTLLAMKNGYHLRSVLYYIRTERIKPEFIGPIKQVTLNISVENLQSLIKDNEGINIESQFDSLISKWVQRNQLGG